MSAAPRATGHPAVKYPPALIALHWITVGAILIAVGAVLIREVVEGRASRLLLLDAHRSLGILVIGLLLARLPIRLRQRKVLPDHGLPRLLSLLATLSHGALYLLLAAVPLLGWWQTSLHGQTIHLFGLLGLPPFTAADADFADTLADYHEYAAWLLLALVGAHLSAALWHHFIRRDDVLRSMLPWSSAGTARPGVAVTDSAPN